MYSIYIYIRYWGLWIKFELTGSTLFQLGNFLPTLLRVTHVWGILRSSSIIWTGNHRFSMVFLIGIRLVVSTCFNPSEKILVSWDYYAQYMEKTWKNVPNHQPGVFPRVILYEMLVWLCVNMGEFTKFLTMDHGTYYEAWSVGDIWGLSIHILCRTSMSLERNLMFLLPKPTITVGYDWQSFMKMAKWFKHLWNNPFEQTNQWCSQVFLLCVPGFCSHPTVTGHRLRARTPSVQSWKTSRSSGPGNISVIKTQCR